DSPEGRTQARSPDAPPTRRTTNPGPRHRPCRRRLPLLSRRGQPRPAGHPPGPRNRHRLGNGDLSGVNAADATPEPDDPSQEPVTASLGPTAPQRPGAATDSTTLSSWPPKPVRHQPPRRLLKNGRVGSESILPGWEDWRVEGRTDPQCEILDVESVAGHLLPAGGVFAFLAGHRRELFPEAMFADLFKDRKSVV